MKTDPRIRSAIDESLSSVHFDARDMHAVLRGVHASHAPRHAKKRRSSLAPVLVFAIVVLMLTPLTLLALRAGSMPPQDITTIAAAGRDGSHAAAQPDYDPVIVQTPSGEFTADEAIAAARACFEAHCDTSIFSFDEYAVDVQATYEYGSNPAGHDYLVTMNSIYGNGCSFCTVVSASGEILSYSAPELATIPAPLSRENEAVRAWHDKYGEYLFTWPMDVQAEFSRRYEGAMLRMPRENELDSAAIGRKLGAHYQTLIDASPQSGSAHHTVSYSMSLRSERAYEDGQARYLVYCFLTEDLCAPLPDLCMRLTFLASDGTLEAKEILPTAEL